MLNTYQRCQNCRFFKRNWKKVKKKMGQVPGYLTSEDHRLLGTYIGKVSYLGEREVTWQEYEPEDHGVCRRYPPQFSATDYHKYYRFPTIHENGYCGEWRPILISGSISAYEEE